MPFMFVLMGIPVMVYIARLSMQVMRLLSIARGEQQRLAAILAHIVDPVLVSDRQGLITLANAAAWSVLGVEPGTRLASVGERLAPSREAAEDEPGSPHLEVVRAARELRPLSSIDLRVRTHDGERPMSVSTTPVLVEGMAIGAVTVFHDLTDRARFERERLKTERFAALGAMAERLAHDFGNYLEAASAATAMLEKPSSNEPGRRMRWTGLIRTTIDEGRTVLASLRTLSFISHRKPRFFSVAIKPLLERAIDTARLARRDAPSITIRCKAPDDLVVEASEPDLARAFVNVLVNAIDAMPGGGEIRVWAEYHGAEASVHIADSGVGIPSEEQERIFEMHYTTKGERGSGMGLTLAREVVQLHGGRVALESEPGRGATFTISLPTRHPERTTRASGSFDRASPEPARTATEPLLAREPQ